jgi:hypothetical protein
MHGLKTSSSNFAFEKIRQCVLGTTGVPALSHPRLQFWSAHALSVENHIKPDE